MGDLQAFQLLINVRQLRGDVLNITYCTLDENANAHIVRRAAFPNDDVCDLAVWLRKQVMVDLRNALDRAR